MTHSAKGTRLNRKGIQTRQALLASAVRRLAAGGPEAASANRIARDAGVTWGTVQHQFGDVDGLWAAVLHHICDTAGPIVAVPGNASSVHQRVAGIVEQLWRALDSPGALAIQNLRQALPRQRERLEADYPLTAAAILAWDTGWTEAYEKAFQGLEVDRDRLRRVRALLPGAMRGLHSEAGLSTYIDLEEAKQGLVEALTAYLS
ncbi:hypothetical protein SacmaDRAFT_5572 [Saccharomonospora marina XMU15]|uniref:HTH tetR-type domain-containing protein n=1 Tax=Saccharomonospora marina XMU15 TaxID=882083 RepID=H5XA28_9PSEU|nr:TetR/AcrR family transcriptional regulator [Saccharomonospora marina]EHR53688.1 hypothetical protein SacmaDRAFT_5572 [Saccharomonospora marina XMU15]